MEVDWDKLFIILEANYMCIESKYNYHIITKSHQRLINTRA